MSFLGNIEKALNDAGKDLQRAVDDGMNLTIGDRLRPGSVVQLTSKLGGKCLRVTETGAVDCYGEGGLQASPCHFMILQGSVPNTIRLHNVYQPQYFLAINRGYFIGNGQGGKDCDFYATIANGQYAVFESASEMGSHIGVLPSGQISAPAQTNKSTEATHFTVRFIEGSMKKKKKEKKS